jgi:hypothetical protein
MSPATGHRGRSWLISSVGLVNLLLGGLCVAFGVYCFAAGADAVGQLLQLQTEAGRATAPLTGAEAQKANALLGAGSTGLAGILLGMVAVLAACAVLQGLPLLLAGMGLLYRKSWGRVLALLFAFLALLQGLACVLAAQRSTPLLAAGLVWLGYALLTFVALIGKRASLEFSGRMPPEVADQPPPGPFRQVPERRAERPAPETPAAARAGVGAVVLASVLSAVVTGGAVGAILYWLPPRQTGAPAGGPQTSGSQKDRPAGQEKAQARYEERLAPFLEAAEKGQTSRLLELLATGIDVDDKDAQGETALMKAAANGQLRVTHVLLALGANLNEKDRKGRTPLMKAAANGHSHVVDALFGGPAVLAQINAWRAQLKDLPGVGKGGKVPHDLKGLGDLKFLGPVLLPAVEVEARDKDGMTALMYALLGGHDAVVQTLRLKTSAHQLRDRRGNSVVLLAAMQGKHALFRDRLLRDGGGWRYRMGPAFFRTTSSSARRRPTRTAWTRSCWRPPTVTSSWSNCCCRRRKSCSGRTTAARPRINTPWPTSTPTWWSSSSRWWRSTCPTPTV